MAQTETVLDTASLDEIIHWIKALKEVGVSADMAANVTVKFFLASASFEDDDYYDQ